MKEGTFKWTGWIRANNSNPTPYHCFAVGPDGEWVKWQLDANGNKI